MSTSIEHGKVTSAHWVDDHYGNPAREVTLEVTHQDGTVTLLVVPVDRMSERLPAAPEKPGAGQER